MFDRASKPIIDFKPTSVSDRLLTYSTKMSERLSDQFGRSSNNYHNNFVLFIRHQQSMHNGLYLI